MIREGAAWSRLSDGLQLSVRVTPRSGRDAIAAGTAGYLAARLAAAPVDGAANAALIALVAKSMGVAKRDVSILAGETARLKRIRVAGDPEVLAQRAASLYGAAP